MSQKLNEEPMTSRKSDAEEAAEQFDYVRFTFADIHGIARCKSVARRNLKEFFADGITVSFVVLQIGPRSELLSLSDELKLQYRGNMTVKPVPGTLHPLPWAADGRFRVGEIFCEMYWLPEFQNDAVVHAACPRYVARKQLDRLAELGYKLYSGYEAEFIVFDANGKPIFDKNDVLSNLLLSEFESYLYSMDKMFDESGVNVATFQTEYTSGQFELALHPKYGIEAADQMFLLKEGVKEMTANLKGWQATFMTWVSPEITGNGLHFNHSLWSTQSGLNALHDNSLSDDGLSSVARHWLAGLIHHGPALTALCSPTVNCYRRIGQLATPEFSDWGFQDRSAMIRVRSGHPVATFFENRIPSGAANPYLVLAATVAAGIDGIVNQLHCPHERSAAIVSSEQQPEAAKLPTTLSEALVALEEDQIMCDALGEEFIRWFTKVKREIEITKISKSHKEGRDTLEMEREMYQKFI